MLGSGRDDGTDKVFGSLVPNAILLVLVLRYGFDANPGTVLFVIFSACSLPSMLLPAPLKFAILFLLF